VKRRQGKNIQTSLNRRFTWSKKRKNTEQTGIFCSICKHLSRYPR